MNYDTFYGLFTNHKIELHSKDGLVYAYDGCIKYRWKTPPHSKGVSKHTVEDLFKMYRSCELVTKFLAMPCSPRCVQ